MSIIEHRGQNSTREPSPEIWADLDKSLHVVPGRFVHVFEDFNIFPTVAAGAEAALGNGYKGFASTGGSGAVADETGGVLTLSSDGDDESCGLAALQKCVKISRSTGKVWFECRVKSSTITDTKHAFFFGLGDTLTLSATVPLTAAGALADENVVGFHRPEGDGDGVDFSYKADGVTAVIVNSDLATLVSDTYVKLGFVYDPQDYSLTAYVNGVANSTTKTIPSAAGTDFPNDVNLGFVAGIVNATASTPGSSSIDWYRLAYDLIP
jgi:hypothetical protein